MGRVKPYRVVSRDESAIFPSPPSTQVVQVGPVPVGGAQVAVIAGPCAVESREQTLAVARAVRDAGAHILRGGAYKPRTSPYDFQGLGLRGLEILAEAREETGLPVVTEVMDPRLVDQVAEYADCLQVGARNMQNFALLREVGRRGSPVLLKRHWAATLEEWLGAAEYIAAEGNLQIVLCERGVRTFSQGSYNRFTLDLNVVQAVRRVSFLPVIVDPSHGTGVAGLVPSAARAGLAAGAHGLIIEVLADRADPEGALCDGYQSIPASELARLIDSFASTNGKCSPWPVDLRAS